MHQQEENREVETEGKCSVFMKQDLEDKGQAWVVPNNVKLTLASCPILRHLESRCFRVSTVADAKSGPNVPE